MFRYSCVLFCALVLCNVDFINARKSYSGGGGKHASYPRAPPGSLSGSGGHNAHRYPPSTGSSGHGGGGGYPSYQGHQPQGNTAGHGYPPAGGNSPNHGYPPNPGHSGSNTRYQGGKVNNPPSTTTNIHNHYYSPPQQIHYAAPHGQQYYPVYRGAPPTYVYQYKDSGSKYGTLLAGLALLNLGVLAGGIAGHSHSHSQQSYTPRKGEICIFGVKKDNGDYEETKIDCQLITSFIYKEEAAAAANKTTQVMTVTTETKNTTVVNAPNPAPDAPQPPGPVNINVNFTMLPNGTLIPIDVSSNGTGIFNATSPGTAAAPGGVSSVMTTNTTTTTTTTVQSALDVKGAPVSVTPGMQCYVIRRIGSSSVMRKTVPCGLLQTYAEKSFKPNSSSRNVPAFTIFAVMCAVFVMH